MTSEHAALRAKHPRHVRSCGKVPASVKYVTSKQQQSNRLQESFVGMQERGFCAWGVQVIGTWLLHRLSRPLKFHLKPVCAAKLSVLQVLLFHGSGKSLKHANLQEKVSTVRKGAFSARSQRKTKSQITASEPWQQYIAVCSSGSGRSRSCSSQSSH